MSFLPLSTVMALLLPFLLCITVMTSADSVARTRLEPSIEPRTPAGWTRADRVPSSTPLKLTFAVKQRNLDLLEENLLRVSSPSSPDYGQWLSMEQVNLMVAPPAAHLSIIKSWLLSEGVSMSSISASSDYVTAWVPASLAEQLLQCRFHFFHHTASGAALVRSSTHYSLPTYIAQLVDFVAGVRHFPVIRKQQVIKSEGPQAGLGVTPSVIREQYNIGDTTGKSSKNKQSVVQFIGQYYSQYDLDEFFLVFYQTALGQAPKVVGPNSYLPGVEASLDIEYIMSVGSLIETWFWSNPNTNQFNQEPFLEWLWEMGNATNPPFVNSVSYGDDEDSLSAEYAARVNAEFMKQGLRGISILFASGDSGVGGEYVDCSTFVPDFPASSPWVTAVGGTALGFLETPPETANSISGGGFSNYFDRPAYQKTAVASYLSANAHTLPPASYWNQTGRGYPDVSALSSNFVVVIDLIPMPGVAGTSCAAPTFSGVISLLNDLRFAANKPQLGFLNPWIYETAVKFPNAFNDITDGSNPGCESYGFSAAKGWDPVTGVGSPNYAELAKVVAALN